MIEFYRFECTALGLSNVLKIEFLCFTSVPWTLVGVTILHLTLSEISNFYSWLANFGCGCSMNIRSSICFAGEKNEESPFYIMRAFP